MPTETAKPPGELTPQEQLERFHDTVGSPSHGSSAGKPKLADDGLTQSERFMQAARDLECDDDSERFAERVRNLVKVPQRNEPSPDAPKQNDRPGPRRAE